MLVARTYVCAGQMVPRQDSNLWRRRALARLGHSTPQPAMRYQHAAKGRDHEIAALPSKLAGA